MGQFFKRRYIGFISEVYLIDEVSQTPEHRKVILVVKSF